MATSHGFFQPHLGRGYPYATLNKGVGDWLTAYLASLSDGLYIDTTKTDRFFQENTGATLADDVGEAMGLALDQRLWSGLTLAQLLAAQSELAVNGNFAADLSGWTDASTAPSTVIWSAGKALWQTDGSNNARLRQSIAGLTIGATYRVAKTGGANLTLGTSAGGTQYTASFTYDGAFYFVATSATLWLNAVQSANGVVLDNVSVKLVPGNHALQATGTLKPTRQTTGAKFDGSDDNWLPPYRSGGAGDFIVALVNVPASVPTTAIVAGARAAADTQFALGFSATLGRTIAGVGSVATGAGGLSGTINRLGSQVVIGLSANGSLVRLFDDDTQVIETAQSGSIDTTVPYRIGCFNDGGAAGVFFGGSVEKIATGRDFLDLPRYLQIRNRLLASPETSALIARFTTPPTAARTALIDSLIRSLKTAGLWTKLDAFYILAAETAQAAQRNWIADAYNLTPVSSPTFTTDRGYTGNASTAHLTTGLNPTTSGGKYTQNSATLGSWSRTDNNANYCDIGADSGVIGSIRPRVTNLLSASTNATASLPAIATSIGLSAWSRTGASVAEVYKNGASLLADTTTSLGLPNASFVLLARGTTTTPDQFSGNEIAAAFIGQGLNDAEHASMFTAVNTYLVAVGASSLP